jgi:hypothetical protein
VGGWVTSISCGNKPILSVRRATDILLPGKEGRKLEQIYLKCVSSGNFFANTPSDIFNFIAGGARAEAGLAPPNIIRILT